MSHVRLDSDRAGPSGVRFLDEAGVKPEGSDCEDGDERVEIDLDDEPRSLLDFLNVRRKKVAKSLYRTLLRLPRRIELKLHNFLPFQLDRELISHNVIVSDLKERVSDVFLKSHDMLEGVDGLRWEKVALEVTLLSRLEELKKALDKLSMLQERAASV